MQVIEPVEVERDEGKAEALPAMANMLDSRERQLLVMWTSGMASRRVLADLMRCSPGTVGRRLRRVMKRLKSDVVQLVARHGNALPPDLRYVAIHVFIRGEARSAVARQMGISRTQMIRLVDVLRGWADVQARLDRQSK